METLCPSALRPGPCHGRWSQRCVMSEWAGVCQGQSQGWWLNLTSNPATLSVSSDSSH